MSKSIIQVNNCPAGMSEAYAIHAANVVNHQHADGRIKKTLWDMVKEFAEGRNARFRGDFRIARNPDDYKFDITCLLPLYRDYLADHPERSFYATPTRTFNGIELGQWIDYTKKTIGRNRAFKWFREKELFSAKNEPIDELIRNGWVIQVVGQRVNEATPIFTPAGVAHFAPIIASDYYFLGQEQL